MKILIVFLFIEIDKKKKKKKKEFNKHSFICNNLLIITITFFHSLHALVS